MKNKKRISFFLVLAFVFNMLVPFNIFAEETADEGEQTVYLNEGFGAYTTNSRNIEGYTITNAEGFVISETGAKDKAAKFLGGGGSNLSMPFSKNIADNFYIVSASVLGYGKQLNFKVSLVSGSNPTELFSVKGGELCLSESNKKIGGISPSGTTKIDVKVDAARQRIDIFVNGKCKIKEWSSSKRLAGFGAIRIEQTGANDFALSDVQVYSGKKISDGISDKNFNPNTTADFYLEKDASDLTYFHSRYISNIGKKYPFTSFVAKTDNSYVAEALINWKDPNKGERIILTRGSNVSGGGIDVYMDVNLKQKPAYFQNQDATYKYWMLEGDFEYTGSNLTTGIMMLRDNSAGSNVDYYLFLTNGTLKASGEVITNLKSGLETNRSYHILTLVDLETHTMDVYLDNELVGADVPVSSGLNKLSLYRCIVQDGQGDFILKNWEFRGMTKRFGRQVDENGTAKPVIYRTSKFADNEKIKEYLADKTVFHGDGGLYYKNGEKTFFEGISVYENNELYISPEDFNKAFETGINYSSSEGVYKSVEETFETEPPKEKDGKELYPVKALSRAMGFGASNNGYGSMIIVAKNQEDIIETTDRDMPWFDVIYYNEGTLNSKTMVFSDAQEISNFVFYDRPNAAQIKEDFEKTTASKAAHPRLMINSDDVTRLRGLYETDAYFKDEVESLLRTADADLTKELPYFADSKGLNTLDSTENMRSNGGSINYMTRLALAYVLTGDTKYSDSTIKRLMHIVDTFHDLNPAHPIDLGIWLYPISFAYDWCYDQMTDEQRTAAAKFILEKGVEPGNRAYYSQITATGNSDINSFQTSSWWPTWKSNYTGFIHGGLVPAALAVCDVYPELAFDTVEKALRAYEYMNFGFYPGGVWLEGKSYQQNINYNTAYACGSMLKCLGTDYKILEYKGMHEGLISLMSYGSLTSSFSFSDDSGSNALGGVDQSYQFYANYYNDPVLSMWRQLKLNISPYSKKYKTTTTENPNILDIIYYQPMAGEEVLQGFDRVNYFEGGEIFTVHEDWLDNQATFFAAAGGPTLHYHRHYDAGDFLFAKDNVTWTYEFGAGDYNVGSIWTRFGGRSEAHNTITINNSKDISMKESSFVPVTAQGEGEGGAYVVYDMKELYAHHGTEKMDRGFYIGDNFESLRVRDEMSFSKTVTGYWHFHTEAEVKKIDDETMLLSKGDQSILLHINIDGEDFETEFSVDKARPLPESPKLDNDLQAQGDVNQIRIKFVGKGDINITAELFDEVRTVDTTPISQWKAPEKTAEVAQTNDYDFSYSVNLAGLDLGTTKIIPVTDGKYLDVEIVPNDKRVTAEFAEPLNKVVGENTLVKLTGDDGTSTAYTLVKYSQYGELVKNMLYNDLEIKSYDVSSEPEPGNGRTNMFDGDLSTRFCMYYDNALVTMDLGEIKAVDGIALACWKGNKRNYYFDLEVSDDGENFKKVGTYESSGETEDLEMYTFPTEQARFVRFVGHMNSEGDTNNINELRVLQKK